jgi:hypothetical protein
MSFYNVQRQIGNVVVLLGRPEVPAPPLPNELRPFVSQDVWASRIDAAQRLCHKYTMQLIERIWFMVALTASFFVPVFVDKLVFRSLYKADQPYSDQYLKLRGITFAIFFGTLLVFWGPLLLWKSIGRRHVKKTTADWLAQDRAAQAHNLGPGVFLPTWKLYKAGIFRSQAAISISLPQARVIPSAFDPNAPLPVYINPAPGYGYAAPLHAGGAYPYPVVAQQGPPAYNMGYGVGAGAPVDEKDPRDFGDNNEKKA